MADGRRLFHKAHYNILAKRLNEEYLISQSDFAADVADRDVVRRAYERLVWELAAYFIADNPKFEPELWFERCGFDPAKMIERFNTE